MNDYCVYEHLFPNGKRYIGISRNAEKRWRNGKGYDNQPKISHAINYYGWGNIQHNIIVDGIGKRQAETLETYLISALNTIDNGYNTSIGGDNINTSYLNEHILFKIRESKRLDEKYEQKQNPGGIVSIFESAKYNHEIAENFNIVDETIEKEFPDYKELHSNMFYDGEFERCEAYWYYARIIYEEVLVNKKPFALVKGKIKPYERYRAEFYLKAGD